MSALDLQVNPLNVLRARMQNEQLQKLLDAQDYRAAVLVGEELIALAETAWGPGSPGAATAFHQVARAYAGVEDFASARALLERAARIHEAAFGTTDTRYAQNLVSLCETCRETGDYAAAIEHGTRAAAILESALGPNDEQVGSALNTLSQAYAFSGDYVAAEPLLRRYIGIAKDAGSQERLAIANKNLGDVLQARGQYRQAAELHAEAVRIFEEVKGKDHPLVATALIGLADALEHDVAVYPFAEVRASTHVTAKSMVSRARRIYAERLGEQHSSVALADNRLARLALELGQPDEAVAIAQASADRMAKQLGPEHPHTLTALGNVALLCSHAGRLTEAERRYRDVLAAADRVHGERSPAVMTLAHNYSALCLRSGRIDHAISASQRAADIEDQFLERAVRSSAEGARRAFVRSMAGRERMRLSLHNDFAPASPAALSLALTTLLRRRGRELEASSDVMRALRATMSPEAQQRLDAYRRAAGELAAVLLQGGADQSRRRELEQQLTRAEEELSAQSAEFRHQLVPPATVDALQKALPHGTALIELVVNIPYRAGDGPGIEAEWTLEDARYVAYVVRRDSAPASASLSPTTVVDDLCRRFRTELAARSRMAAALAGRLYEALFEPLEPLLEGISTLHLCLEGKPLLIPFAALRDATGEPLLMRYLINYVDTGRQILRFGATERPRQEAVVVADPDFRPAADGRAAFPPLPGTKAEARALATILPQALVLTGSRATKSAVGAVHGPRVLHLATHGFVDSTELDSPARGRHLVPVASGSRPAATRPFSDERAVGVMGRSGLALAGANQTSTDGHLTAQEMVGIDLVGTRLAVLSACDTGLGDIDAGDGVYGLRRALSIAGAQSQVLSLWKVDDEASCELMVAYYGALALGVPRAEALRRAQKAVLARGDYADPIFWAAFVSIGDPGPVDLREPLYHPPPAAPRPPEPPEFPESFFLEAVARPTLKAERIHEIPAIVAALEADVYGVRRIEMLERMMRLESYDGVGPVPDVLGHALAQYASELGAGRVGEGFRFHLLQVKRSRDVKGLSLLWQRAIEEANRRNVPPPRPPPVDPSTLGPDDMVCPHCGGVQRSYLKFCLRCNGLLRPEGTR